MESTALFIVNSILLGAGLAMDAFSVSIVNGLNEADMKRRRMCLIAGVFAFFQFLMPMVGWFLAHSLLKYFTCLERYIPITALVLLCFIGIKMIIDRNRKEQIEICFVTFPVLMIQGVATSIDALSVGITIAEYRTEMALLCSIIIAATTFIICMAGIILGRKASTKLSGRADILGGIILILIGLEIFIRGIFF